MREFTLWESRTQVGTDSDQARLLRAQQGDREALRALVVDHRRRMERLALSLVGEPEAARDIVQEAFVRMLRSLLKLETDWGLRGWLDRVVVNLAVDYLRRAGRHRHQSLETLPEPEDRPRRGEPDGPEGLRERVYKVLERLPTKYRTVLVLRDIEGRGIDEIARLLGRRPGTVRWRLSVARRRFRDHWCREHG